MSKNNHIKDHLNGLRGALILGVVDDGGDPAIHGLVVRRSDDTYAIAWIMQGPLKEAGPGFLELEEDAVEEGDLVAAQVTITEGGTHGDTTATLPDPRYIHAVRNDVGEIVKLSDGVPTVRFKRTGTTTRVKWAEIRLLPERWGSSDDEATNPYGLS